VIPLFRKLRRASLAGLACLWLLQGAAWGAEPWRAEFDATCSQTDEAMALSLPELDLLLQRCSALQKIIEAQEESVRKVYLKRLQLCRNLYAYVVEFKKNEAPAK
jgi:hypothetical protein